MNLVLIARTQPLAIMLCASRGNTQQKKARKVTGTQSPPACGRKIVATLLDLAAVFAAPG